jgi:hypothetical protein
MSDEIITRAEATVLIDERIRKHDTDVDAPKHRENQDVLRTLAMKVDTLIIDITKMVATQNITMKFAGAGIIVWSIKQIIELVQSFHH